MPVLRTSRNGACSSVTSRKLVATAFRHHVERTSVQAGFNGERQIAEDDALHRARTRVFSTRRQQRQAALRHQRVRYLLLVLAKRHAMRKAATPAYITSLLRHLEDLRDGTHGGSASRKDKEAHFETAVRLLGPIARKVLTEMNSNLLLDSGQLSETGLQRTADGGVAAAWTLSWPEQRAAGIQPIVLQAYFGSGFHHPHLRGATVGDWPLNVFSHEDAEAELPILRAIASSDLHNLVFAADFRIVPAVTADRATHT
jgi:hypothetical protein